MFKKIQRLCTPAKVYFFISILSLIYMMVSNMGNKRKFCMGNYECPIENVSLIYIIKMLYILLVTIILESLCKNGYSSISWFLILFPFLFFFIALGFFMIKQKNSTVLLISERD